MANEIIASGSVSDLATQQGTSIENVFYHDVDVIVILDTSSSMNKKDGRKSQTRLTVATAELEQLQKENPGKVALIEFADSVIFQPGGVPLETVGGMTDIAKALRFVLPADNCEFTFVLVSDGEPDSEKEALDVARKFSDPIHTIYCGPEDDLNGGRRFLEKLASLTNGKFNYQGIGELAKPVQNLITAQATEVIHL